MHDTVRESQGKWTGILVALGIDQAFLTNKPGPCPMCGGKDRFRYDDKDGKGTFFCNQCGAGNGMKLAMFATGLEFKDTAKKIDAMLGVIQAQKPRQEYDPMPRLKKIQSELQSIDGINPVRLYLRSRGIKEIPESYFRFHPAIEYYDDARKLVGKFPAMVARICDQSGKPLTYHVTHLTKQGRKAPVDHVKKIMRTQYNIAGSAIRLSPVQNHIALAEGIETALAVKQLFGLDCWATVNATMMEKFQVPAGIEKVTIFGDNDSSFTGQKAAFVLANRIYQQVEVVVNVAPSIGTDFADMVEAQA